MNNSIETIWKNAFIEDDALIAPQVNDLYNKKSIHIIDQFNGMFKSNLNAIAIGAILQIIALTMMGLPLTGLIIFSVLVAIVYFGRRELKNLSGIDKSDNSYKYLKDFDDWLNHQISHYSRLYTFVYPLFFLSFPIGAWFSDKRESVLVSLILAFPDSTLINGVPLTVLVLVGMVTVILTLSGGALYRFEVGLVYGKVIAKLKEMLSDMTELKKHSEQS